MFGLGKKNPAKKPEEEKESPKERLSALQDQLTRFKNSGAIEGEAKKSTFKEKPSTSPRGTPVKMKDARKGFGGDRNKRTYPRGNVRALPPEFLKASIASDPEALDKLMTAMREIQGILPTMSRKIPTDIMVVALTEVAFTVLEIIGENEPADSDHAVLHTLLDFIENKIEEMRGE